MFIRIHSDLHTEFVGASKADAQFELLIPSIPGEEDMVLVLAGDIIADIRTWAGSPALDIYSPWFKDLAQRHTAVIYVAGNHEGYQASFKTAFDYLNGLAGTMDNFHVLENDTVVVDGVKFIGTTKWTPLDGPHDQFAIQQMNDTKVIAGWNVFKWREAYQKARSFLEAELANEHTGPVVVVTHHTPSWQSIASVFRGSPMNCGYASNEEDLMFEHKPELWFHGHTHVSFDYMVEDYDGNGVTRVICNPYGYYRHEENLSYDPTLTVEV
jgi:UDP-2,3-diacylglucosamine pyrophosphatase LpxH